MLQDFVPQDITLLLALLGVAVAGIVFSVGSLAFRDKGLRTRLRDVAGDTVREPGSAAWAGQVAKAAAPVAKLATPTDEAEISRIRSRFMHAGFRNASAPVIFFALKAVLALGFPLLLVLFTDVMSAKGYLPLLMLLLAAAFGYYLPNVVLGQMTKRRQLELFEAFPDALDLIIVCVEAGLSLDAAIARTAGEMKVRSPVIAEELHLVELELRLGVPRDRALRNFAARTGLEEISSFVAMLLQADRFGTSVADSLRVQADMLRVRRRQRAEEMAAKIPLKMLFPLIFFIFPSLMLVLMGPAMIQVYRILLPTMAGN
jgi:tight adherence protein C